MLVRRKAGEAGQMERTCLKSTSPAPRSHEVQMNILRLRAGRGGGGGNKLGHGLSNSPINWQDQPKSVNHWEKMIELKEGFLLFIPYVVDVLRTNP